MTKIVPVLLQAPQGMCTFIAIGEALCEALGWGGGGRLMDGKAEIDLTK